MKTFILIHGSWHSAWNWHKVIPILEQREHKVIALTCSVAGRDKTPIETVTLDTSVQNSVRLLIGIEENVILVGQQKRHRDFASSRASPDKIDKLVYLMAYLIPNGGKPSASIRCKIQVGY